MQRNVVSQSRVRLQRRSSNTKYPTGSSKKKQGAKPLLVIQCPSVSFGTPRPPWTQAEEDLGALEPPASGSSRWSELDADLADARTYLRARTPAAAA